jgi:hypothetical protein
MAKVVNGITIKDGDYLVFAEDKGFLIGFDGSGNPTVTPLDAETIEAICEQEEEVLDCGATVYERPTVMRAKCA